MMGGMGAAPVVIGRKREHANDAADPIIRAPRPKECAVTAIVLNHEKPHEQSGGGQVRIA